MGKSAETLELFNHNIAPSKFRSQKCVGRTNVSFFRKLKAYKNVISLEVSPWAESSIIILMSIADRQIVRQPQVVHPSVCCQNH